MKLSLYKNRIVMAIVIATGALVVAQNGCSRFLSTESSNDDDNSYREGTTSDPHAAPGDIHVIAGAPTAATVYARQALAQFESQLGMKASTKSEAEYVNKRGTLPATSHPGTFGAPMAMAITAIVAELCDDVITQQASLQPSQKFFRDFNMASSGRPTTAAIEYSVRALAISSWERQPDASEISEMQDLISESIGDTEANGHRKSALMLCTVINSTTNSIIR